MGAEEYIKCGRRERRYTCVMKKHSGIMKL
jgi:hypothetical protein